MERQLKETFETLFQAYIAEYESNTNSFMYVCDTSCTGRDEYGLTSAFLLAVLSERKFTIYPNKNTLFYKFYDHAVYNWKIDATDNTNITKASFLTTSLNRQTFLAELHVIEKNLGTMDFEEHFEDDVIFLSEDYNWIQDLRRHSNSRKKMPWLHKTCGCDVIRLVYNGLFQLPETIHDTIASVLIKEVDANKLICFHGNVKGTVEMEGLLVYINRKYKTGYRLYIGGNTTQKLLAVTLQANSTDLGTLLIQVDIGHMYSKVQKLIDNDSKQLENVLHIHILKLCDILIVSESPTGILAAHLRRSGDDIFCYRNGVIFPCTRELIAGSFRDKSHVPESVDMFYLCDQPDSLCTYA